MSYRRIALVVFGSSAFAGVTMLALQRDGERRATEAERTKQSVAGDVRPASSLAYEGPGMMFLTHDGLVVFSPGERFREHSRAFDLHWDEELRCDARWGAVDLFDIEGWMSIQYDRDFETLSVTVTTQDGGRFDQEFHLNDLGATPRAELLTRVGSFFEYMSSPDPEPDAESGAVTVGEHPRAACDHAACSASASGCSCTLCCEYGETASSHSQTPDRCTCTCYVAL